MTAGDQQVALSVDLLKKHLEAAGDEPPTAPAPAAGGNPLAELTAELRRTGGAGEADQVKVVLVIDQFEELLGHEKKGDGDPANRFLKLLKEAIEGDDNPPLGLGTMRSDFLGLLQRSGPLRGVGFKSLPVGPMSEEGMQEVIEQPALKSGIDLQPELTRLLLRETGTPDALPLLAFTLRTLWDHFHKDRAFNVQGYEAIGGLQGAIAKVADDTLEAALAGSEKGAERDRAEKDLRIAFLSLARPADEGGTEWSRQPARWDDMPEGARPMIQRFVDQRLLKSDGETVEVTHEALFRSWETLRGWLSANAEGMHLLREISTDAKKWDKAKSPEDKGEILWFGGRLGRALELRGRGVLRPSKLDTDFIEASDSEEKRRAAEEEARRQAELEKERALAAEQRKSAEQASALAREEARSARRSRFIAWGVTAAAIGAALLALYAHRQRIAAEDQALIASASESLPGDPTQAALLLLELHRPDEPQAADRAVQILSDAMARPLALAELPRHPDSVMTAYYSDDGERLVTACRDGRARVWPAAGSAGSAGKPVVLAPEPAPGADPEDPLTPLTSAVFSPDGKWIITTADAGEVRLWQADGGGQPRLLLGHDTEKVVNTAAFSHDGRIVTASDDGDARVWNPDGSPVRGADNEPLRLTHDENDEVNYAAFDAAGERVLTATHLGVLRVWPAGGGKPLLEHRMPEPSAGASRPGGKRFLTAVFDRTGDRILTASADQTARILRLTDTGGDPPLAIEQLAVLQHDNEVFGAYFAPRAEPATPQEAPAPPQRIVTASKDGAARLWELPELAAPLTEPLSEPRLLLRHQDEVNRASFNPAGDRIVTAAKDSTVRIWRTGWTGEPLVLPHEALITAAWSPDGSQALTASKDGLVLVWGTDADGASLAAEGGAQGEPATVDGVIFCEGGALRDIDVSDVAPGDRRIATACGKAVSFWRTDGTPVAAGDGQLTLEHEAAVLGVRHSPDGQRIVTAAGEAVRLWRARDGEPAAVLEHDGEVRSAVFSGSGKSILTVAGSTAQVWDTEHPERRDTRPIFHHPDREEVLAAAISDDGSTVLTVAAKTGQGAARRARVWATSGAAPLSLAHPRLLAAAMSPSGKWFATTSEDRTARLWKRDGSLAERLAGHGKSVLAAGFGAAEQWVATGSEDETARLWRLPAGGASLVLRGAPYRLASSVELSPDGDRLLVAFKKNDVRIWTVAYMPLSARVRAVTSVCLDPRARRQALGETDATAERRYKRCRASQISFDGARRGGAGLEEAFKAYRRGLRSGPARWLSPGR